VMAEDNWEGKDLAHLELRQLFTHEALMGSDWYAARLDAKQQIDRRLWRRHINYLERFLKKSSHADEAARLGIAGRLSQARQIAHEVDSPSYLKQLRGTIGAEPVQAYVRTGG